MNPLVVGKGEWALHASFPLSLSPGPRVRSHVTRTLSGLTTRSTSHSGS